VFDDRVKVFTIGLPFLHAFFSVALKLSFLDLESSFSLFVSLKLLPQLLLSLVLFLFHLSLEFFGIFSI
jgi:hypothetical protein